MELNLESRIERTFLLVAAVVVNFRAPIETTRCVESLLKSDYEKLVVIVVDNGNDPGLDSSVLGLGDSRVRVIHCNRNLGLSAACNIGIRESLRLGAYYVFLLNNDTIVEKNGLRNLVIFMMHNRLVGVAGPTVLSAASPHLIDNQGSWYNIWLGVGGRFRRGKPAKFLPPLLGTTVTFVSGAAMLISREAIFQVGFLNEALFLYGEDIDYCIRTKAKGLKVLSVSIPVALHQLSFSSGKYPGLKEYYTTRNKMLLPHLQGNSLAVVTASLFQVSSLPLRLLYHLVHDFRAVRGYLSGLLDGLRLKAGPSQDPNYYPE